MNLDSWEFPISFLAKVWHNPAAGCNVIWRHGLYIVY
jgi:hypothetical protein